MPVKYRRLPAAGRWHYVTRDMLSPIKWQRCRIYHIRNATCGACGRTPRTRRRNVPFLYAYARAFEDAPGVRVRGLYCSIACARSRIDP